MSLSISICRCRLLFKHPFGTAHGLRDGTDALFIRMEENGFVGYGEVTLPPYLKESITGALEVLNSIVAKQAWNGERLLEALDNLPELNERTNGCRAGLHTALIDLLAKQRQLPAGKLLDINKRKSPITLMTLGISPINQVALKLNELPMSGALKLKAGDAEGAARIRLIGQLDQRRLFIDGNQGLNSVLEAKTLVQGIDPERILGFEQPFGQDGDGKNVELSRDLGIDVFADESIQNMGELEAKASQFTGVNLKLMKCGGLDRAKAMADRARSMGLKVMLGSMSESSLGCTAMAQLAGEADIVDLDGPWLIKNDPFSGIAMEHGRLIVPNGPGIGANLRAELEFSPICA